jgi:hypothetical protein
MVLLGRYPRNMQLEGCQLGMVLLGRYPWNMPSEGSQLVALKVCCFLSPALSCYICRNLGYALRVLLGM